MLTGERPEVNAEVRERLASYGHEDFTAYVVWACERALERGLLPHTNLGVLAREDLARLREVTASQGLMLESVSERLMQTVHAGSPTKHPARRLETIARCRRAEDPVHERDPRRHRRDGGGADRLARGARGAARSTRPHPGGDPPELRAPPALLRAGAGRDRRRGGARVLAHRGRGRPPGAAAARVGRWCGPGRDRGHEAADRRGAAADARRRHPGPAEPRGLVGRAGRGGRDRPRRPLGQRRSHLARAPVPLAPPGPQGAAARGLRADRAAVRLPASTSTRSGSRRACSTRSRRATGRSSRGAAPDAASRPRRSLPASCPGRSKAPATGAR